MLRSLVSLIAILMLTLGGSANAAYVQQSGYDILVTVDTSVCGKVTLTATGYGLAIDNVFKLVSGRAATLAMVTRAISGEPTVTATFASKDVGENGSAQVRTRYDGYLRAGAQFAPGSPIVASDLLAFRTCQ